jgi:hypothetical protein
LEYIIKIILKCLNSTKQNGMQTVYFSLQLTYPITNTGLWFYVVLVPLGRGPILFCLQSPCAFTGPSSVLSLWVTLGGRLLVRRFVGCRDIS